MTHPHPKRNFVPITVATKSGQVLVNAAKQSSKASTSTARPKVNTAAIRPNVNAKSSYFKPHFPKRRHFNQRSTAKTNTFLRKINTAKGKNATTKVTKVNDQEQIQALVDKKKVIITEDNIRSDLRFDDAKGTACLLNEAIFEGLARMTAKTTAWNEFSSTMASAIICLANNQKFNLSKKEAEVSNDESEDEDHVPTPSSDPLPSGRRVKSPMEKDSLGAQEDASKQGRMIEEIDQNAKIALDDETQGRINDDEMYGVGDLVGEEVVMDTKIGEHKEQIIQDVSTVEPVTTTGEVVTTTVKDSAAPTTDQSQIPIVSSSKDKGKAKMIESEVPIKKKDQMRIDEKYARKLEAEEQEAERLKRAQQDKEANKSWDNIQAIMDADRLLAERL
nr:hypothetical protein [Tanacetum cinerariifolium]